MHILRSTYLPAYESHIRSPYSSDPFPHISPSSSSQSPSRSPLKTIQRETQTLDLFIALKVREDVWSDDSELHLERDESFKDLFELIQPRTRVEDLVRTYGTMVGIICLDDTSKDRSRSYGGTPPSPSPSRSPTSHKPPPPPTSPSIWRMSLGRMKGKTTHAINPFVPEPPPPPQPLLTPLPFSALSVSFSSRKIGLVFTPPRNNTLWAMERKRTIVEVVRTRDERLEVVARKLVGEMRAWLGERC